MQPYNIFSDCFTTMAFGQLYKATNNEEYATIAKQTFQNILKKSKNPKGQYNKLFQGTRPLKSFSLPMILCNLSLEIDNLLDKQLVNALAGLKKRTTIPGHTLLTRSTPNGLDI